MYERKVFIVQRRLTQYRVPLFRALERELSKRNWRLVVLHGQPAVEELTKNDSGVFPAARRFVNRYAKIGGRTLCWQPVYEMVTDADLVIITQESAIISNYYLQLSRSWRRGKVAFWGHGRNFQSASPNGVFEAWKRAWVRNVDWWFAYTQLSVDHLMRAGYPAERITCLNNAIDTSGFRRELEEVTSKDIAELRAMRAIPQAAIVGLYCGSLYSEKRLELLINAADRLRHRMPRFHLAVIGDGPQRGWLRKVARDRPWVHITGALYGRAKAAWYAAASIVLNPGLVGLGVLDAFAAGLPLITTGGARHSPEIAYLKDGVNGRIVWTDSAEEYADAVLEVLNDERTRDRMRHRALEDADRYSIDRMSVRFAEGIEGAVGGVSDPRRRGFG